MSKKALGRGLNALFGADAEELRPDARREAAGSEGRTAGNGGAVMPYREISIDVSAERREAAGAAPERVGAAGRTDGAHGGESGDVSRETQTVKIGLIEPNRNQPRKEFAEESLQELADSIRRYGVLQPLLVQRKGMLYELIAGERRWRAAKLAGLSEVPVIIRELTEQESAEIAIIENIQREDLNPVEEARAYQALIQEFGLRQEELAEKVAKNRSTITNSLRLLQLPDAVLELLSAGQLSAGHARCLVSLGSRNAQEELAQKIAAQKLSVRETEQLVKKYGNLKQKQKKADEEEKELDMYLIDIARKLTASLNTKVLIKQGKKGKGRIEIDYYSNDDLEKIIAKLRN